MDFDDYSGGDGRRHKTSKSLKIRRLYNGLAIPTFTNPDDEYDDDDDCNTTFMSCYDLCTRNPGGKSDKRKYHKDVLDQYYTCPICYDPCIETTVTNCGHKFCKDCIGKWSLKKPVCPICSALITSRNRIYNDDLFIESQLGCLSTSVKDRFETAQNSRLLTLYKSQHSKSMLKSVRRKLDNSVSFLRCKNASELGENVRQSAHRILSSIPAFSNVGVKTGILIGIVLALLCVFIYSRSSFLTYIYLAIQNYNGTIPSHWIKQEATFKLPPKSPPPEEETLFSVIIHTLGNCGYNFAGYCSSCLGF
ncbi:E3 ubiquitin-protein ligase RNF8-B [Orchesella cincta]|uniref:E3 ubiquitin-protein ligase RNF8-B n=1 Tax=Orchesella cincta TaxID=48709 RepID=A0A1D2NMA4_ORCCI|nr:E3 ubiquitin-protein ligase RNF8-B [Orchesella cincta]